MASSEYGSEILTELGELGVSTNEDVRAFRVPGARRSGFDLNTLIAAIQTSRGKQWVSRRRVRSDVLRLLREGAL
jgi:hypothetical protein